MLLIPHVHNQDSHYWFISCVLWTTQRFYESVLLANLARVRQIGPKLNKNRKNWQCFPNLFNMDSYFVLYCAVLLCDLWEHLVDELSTSSIALLFKTSSKSSGNVCSWHTVLTILWAAGSKQRFVQYQGSQGNTGNTITAIADNWNDYRNISLWKALPKRSEHYSQNSPDAFHLLYDIKFKQRTEACFIFGVLLGTIFYNLPPTETQRKQIPKNCGNIQSNLGC